MPRPPTGVPDWLKILLGAALAIATSLLVEFVKPRFARRQLRNSIEDHVVCEFKSSLTAVDGCLRIFERVIEPSVQTRNALSMFVVDLFGRSILSGQRFIGYLTDHKKLMRTIRNFNHIAAFQNHRVVPKYAAEKNDFGLILENLREASTMGHGFFDNNRNRTFTPTGAESNRSRGAG